MVKRDEEKRKYVGDIIFLLHLSSFLHVKVPTPPHMSTSAVPWKPIELTLVMYPTGSRLGFLLAVFSLAPVAIIVSHLTLFLFRRWVVSSGCREWSSSDPVSVVTLRPYRRCWVIELLMDGWMLTAVITSPPRPSPE